MRTSAVHASLTLLALASLLGCDEQRQVDISAFVRMYPSAGIVKFAKESTTLTVTVRNVHERQLTDLHLKVESDACKGEVMPKSLPRIAPGDRRAFAVTLFRLKGKERKRYPLKLTLTSPDLPLPAGLDLMADLGKPADGNWIDVGQVTLVAQKGSRTVYYLLAGVPLLFLVGWMLWRWSRPRDDEEETSGEDGQDGSDE